MNLSLTKIGYRYLDDSTMNNSQHQLFSASLDCRRTLNVLDDDEIRELILTKIQNIKKDVQVFFHFTIKKDNGNDLKAESFQIIFNNFRCLDCSVEGDKRLLSQFCHMEKHLKHVGAIDLRHTKGSAIFIKSNFKTLY